jgi:hypothetical protein
MMNIYNATFIEIEACPRTLRTALVHILTVTSHRFVDFILRRISETSLDILAKGNIYKLIDLLFQHAFVFLRNFYLIR